MIIKVSSNILFLLLLLLNIRILRFFNYMCDDSVMSLLIPLNCDLGNLVTAKIHVYAKRLFIDALR